MIGLAQTIITGSFDISIILHSPLQYTGPHTFNISVPLMWKEIIMFSQTLPKPYYAGISLLNNYPH